MAPNRESMAGSYSKSNNNIVHKPRLSTETLRRTKSDILFELSQEDLDSTALPPVSEVQDAKCESCGMSEECTIEYITLVREQFSGKMICGLCAEAVNEEMEKNGGKREEALNDHINACVRFNSFGRENPVLYQAEAMREMLKNSKTRAKSTSPREKGSPKKGGIARSSSCIPALTKEIRDLKIIN